MGICEIISMDTQDTQKCLKYGPYLCECGIKAKWHFESKCMVETRSKGVFLLHMTVGHKSAATASAKGMQCRLLWAICSGIWPHCWRTFPWWTVLQAFHTHFHGLDINCMRHQQRIWLSWSVGFCSPLPLAALQLTILVTGCACTRSRNFLMLHALHSDPKIGALRDKPPLIVACQGFNLCHSLHAQFFAFLNHIGYKDISGSDSQPIT